MTATLDNNASPVSAVAAPFQIATRVGAVTAAVLSFALIVLPILIISPDIGAWWELVLLFSTAIAVVSGIAGGIAGRLASTTSNSTIGAAIGILVFLAVGIGYSLFCVSSKEPPFDKIRPLLFAAVVGGASGATSSIHSRPKIKRPASLIRYLPDAVVYTVVLAILSAWFMHESIERQLCRNIQDAGGRVIWDASVSRPGYWVIEFSGAQLDDSGLKNLLPTLNEYPRLDLDLRKTRVSYPVVGLLSTLGNLARLRLDNTVLAESELTNLEHELPSTEIIVWRP